MNLRFPVIYIFIPLISGCAIHHGMITTTHPDIPAKKYTYIDIAVGYSQATYWFDFGGLEKEVLVQEAKRNMLLSYPLQPNQLLTNATLDIKTSMIWPFRRVQAIAVADVIELDTSYSITYGEHYPNTYFPHFYSISLGESILFADSDNQQLGKGRVVYMRPQSVKVFYPSPKGTYKLANMTYNEIYKTSDFKDIEQATGFTVGDTIRIRQTTKSQTTTSDKAIILGVNSNSVLYQRNDGSVQTYVHHAGE